MNFNSMSATMPDSNHHPPYAAGRCYFALKNTQRRAFIEFTDKFRTSRWHRGGGNLPILNNPCFEPIFDGEDAP